MDKRTGVENFNSDRNYWSNKLYGNSGIVGFLNTFHNINFQSNTKEILRLEMPKKIFNKIKVLSNKSDYAMQMILLSGVIYILYKYTGETDIIVGTPSFKSKKNINNVGKMLPIRSLINTNITYKEFLKEIKDNILTANENQDYLFGRMMKLLNIEGHSKNKLPFKTIVSLNTIQESKIPDEIDSDVVFNFNLNNDTLQCMIEFNFNQYSKEAITKIFEHVVNFYDYAISNPDKKFCQAEIISEYEKVQMLYEFNSTNAIYQSDKCIHELFEKKAAEIPDNIAVLYKEESMTYSALNERANQVARKLRQAGVKPNDIVCIMVDRSPEMLIGVFGILKAGAGYLPIDPDYPLQRIEYIIKDSCSKVLLTKRSQENQYSFENIKVLNLDDEAIYTGDSSNLELVNKPNDLAYVIYTSGSTGTPKGVMIEHHSVINRLEWMQYKYPIDEKDTILQKTPYTFDVSVWELFWWALMGAKVCLPESGDEKDVNKIFNFIGKYNITVMHFVPSMLEIFLEYLEERNDLSVIASLRQVFSSGEALLLNQVDRFNRILGKKCGTKLTNLYGPTEATVDVTYYDCSIEEELKTVPIGKPINNIRMYILNEENELQPMGVAGELCISGVGVARGYFNRPELTGERFINNPYEEGSIMYKTGDLARWLPDGNIEYLGRIDRQVKIGGCRIELGEIENALIEYNGVKQAVVIEEKDENEDKFLSAYIVRDSKIPDENSGCILPNKMSVFDINRNETEFMYREVFENKNYLCHGISINDGDCVFDVGANIGMFTLFANGLGKDIKIYSFEPIPPLFNVLRKNADLHCNEAKVLNVGLSGVNGNEVFTYYPKASIMSGRYADKLSDKEVFIQSIESINETEKYEEKTIEVYKKELLEERFETVNFDCELKTLSQIIKENGIEKIDLLKIDVEKSEMDVLSGIDEQDWKKIKQLVIEVHDTDDQLNKISSLLKEHGYIVHIDSDDFLTKTKLYNVYAVLEEKVKKQEMNAKIEASEIEALEIAASDDAKIRSAFFSVEELTEQLKSKLPNYMIPAYFTIVDSIPLTTSGKIDKNALLKIEKKKDKEKQYVEARNDIERKIKSIWMGVLGSNNIGIDENLFQAGGHSLKAIIFASKLSKEFNVEISIREIFNKPTIRELAEHIGSTEKKQYLSIEAAQEREYYPASSAEKRIFILNQIEGIGIGYNVPIVMKAKGKLDKDKLEAALKLLVKRHESLRTSFHILEGEIVQRISESAELDIEYSKLKEEDVENGIQQFIKPFDLSKAPLIRAGLIELSEDEHIFMMDMHHIITDGISISILMDDLNKLYLGEELESLKIQYKDYSVWQNNLYNNGYLSKQEQYWMSIFQNDIQVLDIPADYPRPLVQSFEGDNVSFKLDKKLVGKLKQIAEETGSTMYMVLLSAINILLHKYSNQEDIIIGTPIAGRSQVELENIVGMFVNTIAMRNYPKGSKTYKEFLQEVRENAIGAYENQEYQFEELVSKLNISRDMNRNPLFDVTFSMESTDKEKEEEISNSYGINFENYDYGYNIAKFDLLFFAREIEGEILIGIQYCTKLFKKETIERMAEHFKNIIKVTAENSKLQIKDVDMLTDKEKHILVYEFNNNKRINSKVKTIHQLFEEQVLKTPDNIALIQGDRKLSYLELNIMANRLARTLRLNGIKQDDIVGIFVDRSIEMIIGIMAILKAGGAYLPLDPEYPEERIKFILEDSRTRILLTQSRFIDKVPFRGKVINLENEKMYNQREDNLDSISCEKNLAYAIYTSGSTGTPKGVLIEHKNIYNILCSIGNQFEVGFDSTDRVLSLTNYIFDVSVCEMFISLTTGAALIINDKHRTYDVEEIADIIISKEITFTYISPSLLGSVYEKLNSQKEKVKLRKLLVGVEPIRAEVIKKFFDLNQKLEIINGYGPTETTICSTLYKVSGIEQNNSIIPIGKPVQNTKILILNQSNNLQPIGIKGEVFISGDGLGRGYLNRPELTAEKFVENPFNPEERLYKTGDLAKWLPDGNIEFIGRKDHQVKIRGFRIELGEIESELKKYKDIRDVVVIDKDNKDNKDKYLCAYIVANERLAAGELRKYLLKRLPDYMLPSYFIQMDKFPLTFNGKVDRKSLPDPEEGILSAGEYEAPRNDIEERLVAIWSEVLGIKKVGINDNFFELGGNSLKAITIATKISNIFNMKFPIVEILNRGAIKEIGEFILCDSHIRGEKHDSVILLKYGNKPDKNLFFIHEVSGDVDSYIELAKHIDESFSCWGIRIDKFKAYGPKNLDITVLAKEYIELIKRIQPEGPYNLAGWSCGGTITFEITRMLEEMQEKVELLVIIDAVPPESKQLLQEKHFTLETEKLFIKGFIASDKIHEEIERANSVEELYNCILSQFNIINFDQLKIEELYKQLFKNVFPQYNHMEFKEIVEKINVIRTIRQACMNYIPSKSIKTPIYYIKACESININESDWDKYSEEPIKKYKIAGNHFNILKYPRISETSRVFSSILANKK